MRHVRPEAKIDKRRVIDVINARRILDFFVDQLAFQRLVALFEKIEDLRFFNFFTAISEIAFGHLPHFFLDDGQIGFGQVGAARSHRNNSRNAGLPSAPGPTPSFVPGNRSRTAAASRCAVEWRITSRPSRVSAMIGSIERTSSVGASCLFRSTSSPLTFAASAFFNTSRSNALIASATRRRRGNTAFDSHRILRLIRSYFC